MFARVLLIILVVSLHCSRLTAGVTFLGPTPYLSAADSPFDLSSNFYLEDFEDGALNTPGVSGDVKVQSGFVDIDSVDADDGVIDGSGLNGHSALPRDGGCTSRSCYTGTTFTFTEDAFGRLPNAVGIVWTDGHLIDFFSLAVYDPSGQLVDSRLFAGLGDDDFEGGTSDDRFIGAIYGAGIGRLEIIQGPISGYFEFDHLQYGIVVPEPSSGWLLGIALFASLCLMYQGGRYVQTACTPVNPQPHRHPGTP